MSTNWVETKLNSIVSKYGCYNYSANTLDNTFHITTEDEISLEDKTKILFTLNLVMGIVIPKYNKIIFKSFKGCKE